MNNTEDYLVEVFSAQPCDVCGGKTKFYHTRWFIHLCSIACLYVFEKGYREEIDSIAIKKLPGGS